MIRPSLFLFSVLFMVVAQAQRIPSVLSEGRWYKLAVAQDGVYKIDRGFLTNALGIDLSDLDVSKIKIYGNGGRMLPQHNGTPRPNDLLENPVWSEGLEDGSFDSDDYLLFYALGPDQLEYIDDQIAYENHVYSDSAFYFLTIDGNNATPIGSAVSASGSFPVINTYTHLLSHELDERNILKDNLSQGGSGREWYGERFQRNVATTRDYRYDLPGFTGSGKLLIASLSQSEVANSMTLSVNGSVLGDQQLDPITPIIQSPYQDRGKNHLDTFDIDVSSSQELTLTADFNFVAGQSSLVRLNYFAIAAERTLAIYDGQTHFNNRPAAEGIQFEIADVSANSQLWDVTEPHHPLHVALTINGTSGSFADDGSRARKFVIFNPDALSTPAYIAPVANQDLHSLQVQDGLIITHPLFRVQAEQLADFHRTEDGLDVAVIDIDEVYNEFGSGSPDITAVRDMIRYFYERSSSLRYALLLGDCSYDYKDRLNNNTNFIPTYESRNSIHPIFSFSSDDYFGFMEEEEGEWLETNGGDHTLDVGIGRLPVKSVDEANDVINKIIRYSTSDRVLGDWKNKVTYVVDDGDGNLHVRHGEELSRIFEQEVKQVLPQKIYLDAFEQELGASRETSPVLTDRVRQAISEGTFLVNYIGHGNEFQWMDEKTVDTTFVSALTNRFRLPIFVTATCQFGRYDDPDFFSGSERLLLAPNGGAIALLTTTRPVFASSNFEVNEAFHETLFRRESGQFLRLGDVTRITKNNSLRGALNRNFSLLGDPMLTLQYPDYTATIDEINGQSLTSGDTLSALEEITLQGSIRYADASVNTDFNGIIDIVLLDAATQARTIGQESLPTNYDIRENALFRGKASVTDGRFSANFILTRNISYRFLEGKISMYAIDEAQGKDASGATTQIRLGGTDTIIRSDNTPPTVDLYLNNEQFISGSVVEPSSLLIARVFDASGLNISENSVNQSITLRLNDGEPFEINDFYSTDVDDFQTGFVTYPLDNLEAGSYSATIKLWDTYNNSATSTVEFVVSDTRRISLENVFNFPNPAFGTTTFNFDHNRLGEELEITIDVYGMDGALKETLFHKIDDSPERINFLTWDIAGSSLEQGIYLYKITVRSTLDGAVGQQFKRLIVN